MFRNHENGMGHGLHCLVQVGNGWRARHRTGYRRSPVWTLPMAPFWCDLGCCSRTVELRRTSAITAKDLRLPVNTVRSEPWSWWITSDHWLIMMDKVSDIVPVTCLSYSHMLCWPSILGQMPARQFGTCARKRATANLIYFDVRSAGPPFCSNGNI